MTDKVRAVQESVGPYLDDVRLLAKPHNNLSDIVNWVASLGRKDTLSDVVTQDEYTHDVLAKYVDEIYLVYNVT